MKVHVFRTGRLIGNETFLRADGWGALLRPRRRFEFPVHSYVIEHPEGLVAIDAGMTTHARVPRTQRRFVPQPVIAPGDEIGPQMRARGLAPEDVRTVVLTHLDWDHVGGIAHFPNANVLVHRPEHEFASTLMGRARYQPALWPAGFRPALYDLQPQPYGPFPTSRAVTAAGDLRVVGLPGHSVGQVGAVLDLGDRTLLFGGDHMLRQDWFVEDLEAGRLVGLGLFFRELAVETSRRIRALAAQAPVVLLPSHDADVERRLATLEPLPAV